jgi:hypothetical protein
LFYPKEIIYASYPLCRFVPLSGGVASLKVVLFVPRILIGRSGKYVSIRLIASCFTTDTNGKVARRRTQSMRACISQQFRFKSCVEWQGFSLAVFAFNARGAFLG